MTFLFNYEYFWRDYGTIRSILATVRKFKYQINHFASIQPKDISIEDLAAILRKEFNIPSHIFDRDRCLLNGDTSEIPEERLKIYAQLLDVSVTALLEERMEQYAQK